MNEKLNNILKDWFMPIYLSSMSIGITVGYFGFPELKPKFQESLPYDTLYYLFSMILICFSLTYVATPLSKVITSNKKFQQWYINQKAKQWRNNK